MPGTAPGPAAGPGHSCQTISTVHTMQVMLCCWRELSSQGFPKSSHGGAHDVETLLRQMGVKDGAQGQAQSPAFEQAEASAKTHGQAQAPGLASLTCWREISLNLRKSSCSSTEHM
eukprot:scaffold6692_cov19-Tisochrysis_lutea.AAC.4